MKRREGAAADWSIFPRVETMTKKRYAYLKCNRGRVEYTILCMAESNIANS
jgi:hypothetical protein